MNRYRPFPFHFHIKWFGSVISPFLFLYESLTAAYLAAQCGQDVFTVGVLDG